MLNRRDLFKLSAMAAALSCLITMKETDLTKYRLGKLPARPHYGLKLADYITPDRLPPLPESFGHENLVDNWQVLANDKWGDCAIAGPYHAEMLWCAEGKKPIRVDDACVLASYAAIADVNIAAGPGNPTDAGSNVQDVAEYWRTEGLKDADGRIHKIDAYMAIEPKNLEQLYHALCLFDGVGIGIACPEEYQVAFAEGQVWDYVDSPHIEGGHYVLGVGKRGTNISLVTWGRTQLMTANGYQQFNDETFVYLNEEKLVNGRDIDGFDVDQLLADMRDLADESPFDYAPVPC